MLTLLLILFACGDKEESDTAEAVDSAEEVSEEEDTAGEESEEEDTAE